MKRKNALGAALALPNTFRALAAFAALFALCCLCACTKADEAPPPAAPESAEEGAGAFRFSYPLTLRVAHLAGENEPRALALASFKENVERATGGRIIIELLNPQSGVADSGLTETDIIEGVINGRFDMAVSSAGNFAAYATRIGISALPFLFDDFETAWAFMDSPIMRRTVADDLHGFNIHVLAYFDNGFRCVTTSRGAGAIRSAGDFEGLSIRTEVNPIVMETISELGANPKSSNYGLLSEALRFGEFDGQENPVPFIYNSGLYKVQKFLALTEHSYDAMPFVIRHDIWKELPTQVQSVLLTAAIFAQDKSRILIYGQSQACVAKLEAAGMVVTRPDKSELKRKTAGVANVFSAVFGEELIGECMEFLGER